MEAVTQVRAKRLVDFWRNRKWLSSAAPIHEIHQLDLTKLEELIAEELTAESLIAEKG
jgi:hypothetical protein